MYQTCFINKVGLPFPISKQILKAKSQRCLSQQISVDGGRGCVTSFHPPSAAVRPSEGFAVVSVSLSVLIKTAPSLTLFVFFSPPVRNWIWEAGDLHQTGQTGGGT